MSRWVSTLNRLLRNLDRGAVLGQLAVFVLVAGLWGTFIVTPLKIFVVLLHEISHGAAAILTGGGVIKLEISAQQGGLCSALSADELTAGGGRRPTRRARRARRRRSRLPWRRSGGADPQGTRAGERAGEPTRAQATRVPAPVVGVVRSPNRR
jgi:hypothetical protein